MDHALVKVGANVKNETVIVSIVASVTIPAGLTQSVVAVGFAGREPRQNVALILTTLAWQDGRKK